MPASRFPPKSDWRVGAVVLRQPVQERSAGKMVDILFLFHYDADINDY